VTHSHKHRHVVLHKGGRTITDHEHVHNHTPFSPYADVLPEGDDYYVYHLNHHGGSSHNADQS